MFNLKSYESKMKTNQQLLDKKNIYMEYREKKNSIQHFVIKINVNYREE